MRQKTADYDYPDEVLYRISGSAAFAPEFMQEIPEMYYEQPSVRQRKKAQVQLQTKYGISITAVAGFVAVVIMAVAILLANINFVALADCVTSLQSEIEELSIEEKRLKIQYEEAFDINEIEKYVTGNLNMTKPTEEQKDSYKFTRQDRGEIMAQD